MAEDSSVFITPLLVLEAMGTMGPFSPNDKSLSGSTLQWLMTRVCQDLLYNGYTGHVRKCWNYIFRIFRPICKQDLLNRRSLWGSVRLPIQKKGVGLEGFGRAL